MSNSRGHLSDLAGRHLEHFPEGRDLVAGHDAVGLGHLRAEHDDGGGKGDLARRPAVGRTARKGLDRPVGDMAGADADNRADRAADCKAGRAAQDFAPDAHGEMLMAPV